MAEQQTSNLLAPYVRLVLYSAYYVGCSAKSAVVIS